MRALLLAIPLCLCGAAPAAAAPTLTDLALGDGNVLALTAGDPGAPVTGVSVDFGAGEDAVAVSGCGRGAPEAGQPTTFSVPHAFASLLPRVVTVTVRSGGCGTPARSASFQRAITPLGPGVTLPPLPLLPVARAAQAPCPGADEVPTRENLRRISGATRCLVNLLRAERGLRPVRAARALRRAGNRHVADMLRHRYFAHERSGGPTLHTRLRRAGYRLRTAGENLAAGTGQYATPRQIVTQWWLSDGHRENMLHPGFRDAGVGVRTGFPLGGGVPSATYALELGVPRG